MTFTDTAGRQVASLARPSSSDGWDRDGALAAPNDLVVRPIARTRHRPGRRAANRCTRPRT